MREHDIRHFSFERPTASVPWEGNERPTLNAAFSWRKTGRGEKPSARGEAGRRRGQTAVFRRSSRDLRDGGQQREPGSCPAALWLPLLALSLRTGTGLPSLGPRAGHAEGVSESPNADGRAPWEGPGCSQNGEPQLPPLAVFLNWGGDPGKHVAGTTHSPAEMLGMSSGCRWAFSSCLGHARKENCKPQTLRSSPVTLPSFRRPPLSARWGPATETQEGHTPAAPRPACATEPTPCSVPETHAWAAPGREPRRSQRPCGGQ